MFRRFPQQFSDKISTINEVMVHGKRTLIAFVRLSAKRGKVRALSLELFSFLSQRL